MKRYSWFGSTMFSLLLAAVLVAQAPVLDVRMGLWEMTTTSNMGGQIPAFDTSKMTPQQKAQVEAAMSAAMNAHTNVSKSCMTKAKFDKGEFMMDEQPGVTCKQAITTNTRATLEATTSCTGKMSMTGQLHIDALSPTSIKATMKSSTTEQGSTMAVNVTMTGKWLAADCGTVQ